MMNRVMVILLNDEGLSNEVFKDINAAFTRIAIDIREELKQNPEFTKWVDKNKVAVVNPKTQKMLSIRIITTLDEFIYGDDVKNVRH